MAYYLISVLADGGELATEAEEAAIDDFNNQLRADGQWVFAGGPSQGRGPATAGLSSGHSKGSLDRRRGLDRRGLTVRGEPDSRPVGGSYRRRASGSSAGLAKNMSPGLIVTPGGTISSMRFSTSSDSVTSAAVSWDPSFISQCPERVGGVELPLVVIDSS